MISTSSVSGYSLIDSTPGIYKLPSSRDICNKLSVWSQIDREEFEKEEYL